MDTPAPKTKPILVTGATGFVGGHVAAGLVDRQRPVRLLVRPTSDLSRLRPTVRQGLDAGDGRVETVEADLTSPASLDGIFDGVEQAIHCACAVKGTFDAAADARRVFEAVNVAGTRRLAERAADAGVRLVHLSSTAAMGAQRGGLVDETSTCRPTAPYQVSKRRAELALQQLHGRRGLDVVILRPCLILGPGKDGGEPLDLFRLARWGVFPKIGGRMDQTKPVVDVRDVVRACIAGLDGGKAGQIYLIHSDGDHRLEDILEVTRRLVGARWRGLPLPVWPVRLAAAGLEAVSERFGAFNPPITPDRLDLFLADRHISVAKARRHLGFEPAHQDLYDMLGRTYVGYVQSGQLNR